MRLVRNVWDAWAAGSAGHKMAGKPHPRPPDLEKIDII